MSSFMDGTKQGELWKRFRKGRLATVPGLDVATVRRKQAAGVQRRDREDSVSDEEVRVTFQACRDRIERGETQEPELQGRSAPELFPMPESLMGKWLREQRAKDAK